MNVRRALLTFMLLLCGLTVIVADGFAEEKVASNSDASGYKWSDKMSRGLVNTFTGPIEIIRGIDLTSKSDGAMKGWTLGLVKGFAGTVMRMGAGVLDFITFPFDFPDKDKAPLVKPTYVWEDWEGEYMK